MMLSIKKKEIKVSVIIFVPKMAQYLNCCLDSILNQTLQEIEVILIDDNSDKKNIKICKTYEKNDKRVKFISFLSKNNKDIKNSALKLVTGKYVCFFESNCFIALNALEKLYQKSEIVESDLAVCGSKFSGSKSQLKTKSDYIPKHLTSLNTKTDGFFQKINFFNYIGFYRVSFILNSNIKFEKLGNALFFYTAMVNSNKIAVLNDDLCRFQSASVSLNDRINQFFEFKELMTKVWEIIQSKKLEIQLKKSFLNYFVPILFSKMENLPYPEKHFVQNEINNEIILKHHLLEYPNEFWEDEIAIQTFKKLKSLSSSLKSINKFRKDVKNIIPVVYATKKTEFIYTLISIQSIIENMDSTFFYDIYIFHSELSQENIYQLKLLAHKNMLITCVNFDYLGDEKQFVDIQNLKLWVPTIFYGYNQIIFVNNTNIFIKDISKLIKNRNLTVPLLCIENLALKPSENFCLDNLFIQSKDYVPFEVAVGNINKWKTEDFEKLKNHFLYETRLSFSDVCNVLFQGKISKFPEDLPRFYCPFCVDDKGFPVFENETIEILFWNILKKSRFFEMIFFYLKNKFHTEKSIITEEIYRTVLNSNFFDRNWYVQHIPYQIDNPLQQYLEIGWKQGYNPGPNFDVNFYLESNPDVKDAAIEPLYHYIKYGSNEHRKISKSIDFKEQSISFSNFAKNLNHKRKNILIVFDTFDTSDVTKMSLNMAFNLKKMGYNSVLLSKTKGEFNPECQKINIPYFYDINKLDMDIEKAFNKFDYIIFYSYNVWKLVPESLSIPYIFRVCENREEVNEENFNFLRSHNASALSELTRDSFGINMPILSDGIKDISLFYFRKKMGKKIKLCMIDLFSTKKAQDLVIKAYVQLTDIEKENLEIHFIGKYTSCIETAEKHLYFYGELPEKKKLNILNSCDFLLCPSLDDSLPLSVMEGMMMYKPCIISNRCGQSKFIRNGYDGFIVHSGSIESLKICFQNLLLKNYDYKKMGKRSYQIYKHNFDQKKCLKNFCNLLKTALVPEKKTILDYLLSWVGKKDPLISVIVASYNYEESVQRTLENISLQSYKNYEVIIVDDSSKDNSAFVIEHYIKGRKNFYFFKNKTNIGLAKTLEFAISQSHGKYISFCESDDFWTPDHLAENIKVINTYPRAKLIVNNLHRVGWYFRSWCSKQGYRDALLADIGVVTKVNLLPYYLSNRNVILTFSSWMVQKKLLKKCNWKYVESASIDHWLLRQLCLNPFYYIPKKLTYWNMHMNSQMAQRSIYHYLKKDEIKNKMDRFLFFTHPFKARSLLKDISPIYANTKGQLTYLNFPLKKQIYFSIIIVIENGKFNVENSINSLLNSTYRNLELLIVDTTSDSKIRNSIKRLYSGELDTQKIRYFYKKNMDETEAKNYALEHAVYEWIIYLNENTQMVSSMLLEYIAREIFKKPNIEFIYWSTYCEKSNIYIGNDFNYELQKRRNLIGNASFAHHRNLYLKHGGFNKLFGKQAEWELCLRYLTYTFPLFIKKYIGLCYENLNVINQYEYNQKNKIYIEYENKNPNWSKNKI